MTKKSIDGKKSSLSTTYAELMEGFDKVISMARELLARPEKKQDVQPDPEINKERDAVFDSNVNTSTAQTERHVARDICSSVNHTQTIRRNKEKAKRNTLGLKKAAMTSITLNVGQQNSKQQYAEIKEVSRDRLAGCKTQLWTTQPCDENESDIIIGLDVGTSSTKVVVRDLVLNQAYAVPFDNYAPVENCYLLPTCIYVNQDGTLKLDPGDLHEADLKLRFINDPLGHIFKGEDEASSLNWTELFTGYLALALREIRGWFGPAAGSISKCCFELACEYWHSVGNVWRHKT